jgi:hypothetical protein
MVVGCALGRCEGESVRGTGWFFGTRIDQNVGREIGYTVGALDGTLEGDCIVAIAGDLVVVSEGCSGNNEGVRGDGARVETIVCENAVKFSDEGEDAP